MYAYSLMPFDYWNGWLTEDEYKRQLAGGERAATFIQEYERFRDQAFAAAKAAGWEGDILPGSGPYIGALPTSDNSNAILIAWKQDSGTTFVVSPIELPWLRGV